MKKYRVPIEYTTHETVEIEANSLEEAVDKACELSPSIKSEPETFVFVDMIEELDNE